jgi:hypothetical protein
LPSRLQWHFSQWGSYLRSRGGIFRDDKPKEDKAADMLARRDTDWKREATAAMESDSYADRNSTPRLLTQYSMRRTA